MVRPALKTQCNLETRYELAQRGAGFHSRFNARMNESARFSKVESHELPYGAGPRGDGGWYALRPRVNLAGARLERDSQGQLYSSTMHTLNLEPLYK